MDFLKTTFYVGACMTAWMITTAKTDTQPTVEDVRWQSVDFKTTLAWSATPSDNTYTVLYEIALVDAGNHSFCFLSDNDNTGAVCVEGDGGNWETHPDCIQISHFECDMTNFLKYNDRTYTADILIEQESMSEYDNDDLPHIYSPPFNPYRQSEISAVNFTVESVEETSVIINVIDPLTSIHERTKQLSIRDILQKDLKYRIIYSMSGSTGKKEITTDSNVVKISDLNPGMSYCFMVAAYISSRLKDHKQGEWSSLICTPGHTPPLGDLSLGAVVGGIFILLVILIIVVTVAFFCCKYCRRQKTITQSSQSTVV